MAINEISIDDILVLKNQFWSPNQGLNILTSQNGGGKTTLLNYIAKKYEKKANIYKISTSIENFRNYEKVEEYVKLLKTDARPPEVRQYKLAYETILTLQSRIDKGIAQNCNDFFQKLELDIELDEYYLQTGRLCFKHKKQNPNVRVDAMQLSSGEKTAFVLWLISISEKKPDVLLLDEFDSSIDEESIDPFYYQLMELSNIYNIQIFIATHRLDYLMYRTNNDGRYNKCGKWQISNGIIQRK